MYENNLKAMTAFQLENQEIQLTMIDLIIYRYLLVNLNRTLLMIPKDKKQTLIEGLNSKNENL